MDKIEDRKWARNITFNRFQTSSIQRIGIICGVTFANVGIYFINSLYVTLIFTFTSLGAAVPINLNSLLFTYITYVHVTLILNNSIKLK